MHNKVHDIRVTVNIILSAIIALILSLGSPVQPVSQPSQPLSQATPEVSVQPLEDAESAPLTAPLDSVESATKWANIMLDSADMELPPTTQIIFSDVANCGAEASTLGLGGCTYTFEDGSHAVVLSPSLAWTQWGNHILFHELGHTVGLGECEAEAYAHQFEEVELWSYPSCQQ